MWRFPCKLDAAARTEVCELRFGPSLFPRCHSAVSPLRTLGLYHVEFTHVASIQRGEVFLVRPIASASGAHAERDICGDSVDNCTLLTTYNPLDAPETYGAHMNDGHWCVDMTSCTKRLTSRFGTHLPSFPSVAIATLMKSVVCSTDSAGIIIVTLSLSLKLHVIAQTDFA